MYFCLTIAQKLIRSTIAEFGTSAPLAAILMLADVQFEEMGYMKHNAVIVTNWDVKELGIAHEKAKEIYKEKFSTNPLGRDGSSLISDIVQGVVNTQASFFIAPDGSKEGWGDSDCSDEARKDFLDWLLKNWNFSDYIEVRFGGDDEHDSIVRSKDSDLDDAE